MNIITSIQIVVLTDINKYYINKTRRQLSDYYVNIIIHQLNCRPYYININCRLNCRPNRLLRH